MQILEKPLAMRRDVAMEPPSPTESTKPLRDTSNQPYVQISQLDDDAGPAEQIELDESGSEPNRTAEPDALPDPQRFGLFALAAAARQARRNGTYIPPDEPVVLGTRARLWTSLPHVLPLAISCFLIAINLQRWYWFDVDVEGDSYDYSDPWYSAFIFPSPDTVSNMLQFGAKVYELLVIASLGALTVKVFKRQLVESRVNLGLLTGAYRVGDVPYLFSTFFRHGAFRKNGFFLALLLFAVTMLATLVGPSSAILLVPDLDWYPLRDAFSNVQLPVFYSDLPVNLTWPRVLNAKVANADDMLEGCDSFTGWFGYWCPSGGFSYLFNWISEWQSSDLSIDLTSHDPTGIVRRRVSVYQQRSIWTQDMVMTTVSMPSLLTVGRLLNFIRLGDMGKISKTTKFRLTSLSDSTIYQPLVQSSCKVFDRDELLASNSTPYFQLGTLNCLGDPVCEKMVEESYIFPRSEWDTPEAMNGSVHLWGPNATENHPLLATLVIPYYKEGAIGVLIFTCSFVAHWMPATLSVSPRDTDMVQSNVTDFLPMFYFSDFSDVSVGPAIKVEDGWLKYLVPQTNVTTPFGVATQTTLVTIFTPLIDKVTLENGTRVPVITVAGDLGEDHGWTGSASIFKARNYVQKILTGMITEGLAHVGSNSLSYVIESYNDTAVVAASISEPATAPREIVRFGGDSKPDIADSDRLPNSVLANVGDFGTPQEFLARLSGLAHVSFEAERYGYGSGKVGPTMTFALVVVSVYLALVAAYFVYVMVLPPLWALLLGSCRSRPRQPQQRPGARDGAPTITAWGDLAELLLLAWNSRPSPRLSRNSVASDWTKWSVQVGIRADKTGRTLLVTSEDGVEKLRKGVRYH